MKTETTSRFRGGSGCRWLALVLVLSGWLPTAALPQAESGPQAGSIRQANIESLVFIEVTAKRASGLEDKFTGTGFIVHPDGYVLTCNHLIPTKEGSDYTQVVCTGAVGGRYEYPYPLTNFRRDEQGDLMLLKLPRRYNPWQSLQSMADAKDGWAVVVLGFPQQQDAVDVPGSIIGVHADGRWLTNTALNPGMSGGPAFDRSGAVVGIVEGGYADTQSLNLLIPISSATSLLQSIKSPLLNANTVNLQSGGGKTPALTSNPVDASPGAPSPSPSLKPVIEVSQTRGYSLISDKVTNGDFVTSVDITLLNPFDSVVTLHDFTISWEKLAATRELVASTGVPQGSELIDYFSVRIADAMGEQRGACTWTFVGKDANGHQTERVPLDSATGAQLLPRSRRIVLNPSEDLRGEAVLKRSGKYRVTLSVVLMEGTIGHPFERSFFIYHNL